MLASIPSPSSGILEIGPFNLRLYGLVIAVAVVAAVLLFRHRLIKRQLDPDGAITMAWVVVPAGLVGARLYHVITDWKLYQDDWLDVIKVWDGGLGIPGAIAGGVLAGIFVSRRMNWSFRQQLDIGAPALPLSQAIGRLGNWFNQELFGRPTDLPWGLEIDSVNVPQQYRAEAGEPELTFHPTFLYEGLWNLGLMGVLLWLDSKRRLPTGHLFACYVLGYATGRLWIELLRIDTASELAGVRVNVWVMSALWLGAVAWLVFRRNDPRLPEGEAVLAAGTADGGAGTDAAGADGTATDAAGVDGTDSDAAGAAAAADIPGGTPFDDDAGPAAEPVVAGLDAPASSLAGQALEPEVALDPQDIPGAANPASAPPAAGAGSASGSVRPVQTSADAASPVVEQADLPLGSEPQDNTPSDSQPPGNEPAK